MRKASRFLALAVVLAAAGLSAEQMQVVAKEFNLSETVFVLHPEDAANTARVRIFTPRREMQFSGHPTVGCACLLTLLSYEGGDEFEGEIRLEENAGLVRVQLQGTFSDSEVVMRLGHPRRDDALCGRAIRRSRESFRRQL